MVQSTSRLQEGSGIAIPFTPSGGLPQDAHALAQILPALRFHELKGLTRSVEQGVPVCLGSLPKNFLVK